MDFFLKENNDFTPFTIQHLGVVSSLIIFGFLLLFFAKNQSKKRQILIGNVFAFCLSLTVIFATILNFYKGNFNYQKDLPLHLCSFMAIIIPVFSITRKLIYYEILLFLVFAGTLQSIITPDESNYLNFKFFRYWFVHAGLIIFMLYATFIYKMRPTIKSVAKSFLAMQIYMIIMFIINYFLGSNYFYTNRKPDAATLLDLFGEWPTYIFVVEIIVIPYFLLIYLPFYLVKKRS